MNIEEAILRLKELTNIDESRGDKIIAASLTAYGWSFQVSCFSFCNNTSYTMLFTIDESGYRTIGV
jgi:hypothetical protein